MLLATAEQRELATTTRQVLADAARVDPVPPKWEQRHAGMNRDLWRSLADLGLIGVGVPEGRGGSGGGLRDLCMVAEEIGAALPRVPFSGSASVLATISDPVAEIANGSTVVVPAWETVPCIGHRDRAAGVRLERAMLAGRLEAVAFGMDADALLAFAGGIPILVDLSAPGIRRTPVNSFDVTEPAAAIVFDSAPVSVLQVRMNEAAILAVLAAELVGTGQRALDSAVEYAGQRHQFGRPIGSFQAIKHLLADRHVQLDGARLLVDLAAMAVDDAQPDAATAARTALAAASEAADAATRDGLQVHGGIGFTWEHPIHMYLKRARARRSLLGSPGDQLDVLAGYLFDRPTSTAEADR